MSNQENMTGITPAGTQMKSPVPEDSIGWSVGGIEHSAYVRSVYGLIGFSGILGNALVCFVLLRVPALRTRTSQFIINLAITDFISCFWMIPLHVFPNSNQSIPAGFWGEVVCRVYTSKFILWFSALTSVYCLTAITLERFVAVVHPVKYKVYYSTRSTIIICFACWAVGFVVMFYHLIVFDLVDGRCILLPFPTFAHQVVLGVYIFAGMYPIPITINLVLHYRIITALRRQALALDTRAGPSVDTDNKRWQLKTANELQKMFVVVIVVFIICWSPNSILFFAFNLGATVDFSSVYYHLSVIMCLCNSCVNPFIYVFKNKMFRQGVLQALGFRAVNAVSAQPSERAGSNGVATVMGTSTTTT